MAAQGFSSLDGKVYRGVVLIRESGPTARDLKTYTSGGVDYLYHYARISRPYTTTGPAKGFTKSARDRIAAGDMNVDALFEVSDGPWTAL